MASLVDEPRSASIVSVAEPGPVLTAEVENFIPVVKAAMPLIRTDIGLLDGRRKTVDLIAKPPAPRLNRRPQ